MTYKKQALESQSRNLKISTGRVKITQDSQAVFSSKTLIFGWLQNRKSST